MTHSPQASRIHASSPRSLTNLALTNWALTKWGAGLTLGLILAGCGAGPGSSSTTAAHSPGDLVAKPDGGFFYADANNMGNWYMCGVHVTTP